MRVDPNVQDVQIERMAKMRAGRDGAKVQSLLADLRKAANAPRT
jgi:methylmalonyl-CoA mutase N-terminal domain/subunit